MFAAQPKLDFTIKTLSPAKYPSPLLPPFTSDENRILFDTSADAWEKGMRKEYEPVFIELAGSREHLFFEPHTCRAAIVTCGGLCPGLNDVIRAIVMNLWHTYGCRDILGLQWGYEGLIEAYQHKPIQLTPEVVEKIHDLGGSILGSSRGDQNIGSMTDFLENNGVDILFAIGGDGTLHAAHEIAEEVEKRGLKRSIIGIPKTIDNDISFVAKSFGFETAFSTAANAIASAHTEAKAARNGIGLVKLMGRHSGFIAANATLANRDVNFCLIPEADFDLDGENGLFMNIRKRLAKRGHAVIVVAEGAGQKFFEASGETDKSGNVRFGDIGLFLKSKIETYFKEIKAEITIKYIDPSYMIRSVPSIPTDSVFCGFLGQMAVHAGMAGKTDMLVGLWNNMFTHLPIKAAISRRKMINPAQKLWMSVMETTGQTDLKNPS
ncbi:MAG: ATP-dependent 6-phosphofructokinase [Spirochaetota bacterium]|jgi:6-phosphofructokinase 1|nr:ATP-dependent 6-phosphofructokinase [Spirochaetota bacterium]